MRIIRFMSASEMAKLLTGAPLHNDTDHRAVGHRTGSKGFCFIVDDSGLTDTEAVYEAAKYLSGIVSMDACLVATVDSKNKCFKKSWGEYSSGKQVELCSETYGLDDFGEWWVYTPANDEGLSGIFRGFAVRSSFSWEEPVLSTGKVNKK